MKKVLLAAALLYYEEGIISRSALGRNARRLHKQRTN